MIQNNTYLNVADNTGAKTIMCITVLSKKSKVAFLGDIFVGVIKFWFLFNFFTLLYFDINNFLFLKGFLSYDSNS